MKQVEIITIGDELLIGQVVDTNSAWMATRLNEWGFQVKQITSVHDDAEQICSALREAERRADVILLTGGLGPTKDDITKHTLCEYFGTALTYHPEIREHLEQLYAARPEVLNRLTDTQCLFPENATLIWNRVGSAQVMCWSRPSSFDNRPLTIISMPGVPYEMMWAMEHGVGEVLRSLTADAGAIVHRTIQVYGIPESSLAIKIEEWEDALPDSMHLAYLPKNGIIRLRLSGYGVQPEEVEKEIQKLLPLLGDLVFATEDLPVEVLAGNILKQRGQTISTAESCTGGKLAELLNRHAGSSAFYRGSVVAYANDVKTGVLGVQPFDDPVTEQVVLQMAEGAKTLLHTDYAIATSGIAGSNGEEDSSKTNNYSESPVGTVWIALATPEGTQARRFQLGKLREQITDRAAQVALIWLIRELGRN
jgi:nicotinamide-nucleotide amidase